MNKNVVIERILELNPNINKEDLMFHMFNEEVYWVCEHGKGHLVYSEAGDSYPSPDECGKQVMLLDPLPDSGNVQCRRCKAWTPSEFMEGDLCPMCYDDLNYKG